VIRRTGSGWGAKARKPATPQRNSTSHCASPEFSIGVADSLAIVSRTAFACGSIGIPLKVGRICGDQSRFRTEDRVRPQAPLS
jgi:hypothetical protein